MSSGIPTRETRSLAEGVAAGIDPTPQRSPRAVAAAAGEGHDQGRYRYLMGALILLMFLSVAGDGLFTFFSGDDLMNMYHYVVYPDRVQKGFILFFTNIGYRPLGGVIYLTLYRLFGFTPLPFKATALVLLLLNLWLTHRMASRLLQSDGLALFAILLVAYNARLNDLYYNFGTIYELTCYTFYYASFLYYLRARERDPGPRLVQAATLCILFLLALEAKEMAVTLPIVLLAYEVCSGAWPEPGAPALPQILRARLPLLGPCFVMMAVYALGKYFGPDSMTTETGYRPDLRNYLSSTSNYLWQWFDAPPELFSGPWTILFMTVGLSIAVASRRRVMLFAFLLFFLALFPVSVLLPKSGYNLYVPSLGLGLYGACLVDLLARGLSGRRVGANGILVFLLALGFLWPRHLRGKAAWDPNVKEHIAVNLGFFHAFERLRLVPTRGARVLLLDDPYPPNSYDPLMLIALASGDGTLVLHRNKNFIDESPESYYDYVLQYGAHSLTVLKRPGFVSDALRNALARP